VNYLSTSIGSVSSIFVPTIADLAGSEEIQPAPSVVHRKVIRYFRFGWGARAYAAIASIVATVALNGISFFAEKPIISSNLIPEFIILVSPTQTF
jgi:hypothetical protein